LASAGEKEVYCCYMMNNLSRCMSWGLPIPTPTITHEGSK